jgi:LacI family transcriptional regulator
LIKKFTTQDVARKAGVSVTTVSRVVNNSDHRVNQKTAQKVHKAIEELGFTPSALARALVTRRSGIIGALVGDNADPYFATIAHGIHSAARQSGFIAILCNTLRDPQAELDFFDTLDQYRADGLLLVGGELTNPHHSAKLKEAVERFLSHGGAVVALSDYSLPVPSICINNLQATYDMTCYLISLGHRRIGYVRGPRHLKTSALREEGFLKAMREAGLPCDDDCRVDGDFSFEGGQRAVEQLLTLDHPPSAVFAANDISALGCLVSAQRRGLKVPRDLSIAGMDDIEATRYVNPSVTTVNVPMEEMGALGVQRLQAALQGNLSPDGKILPHSLMIRGTTAAVE